MRGGRIVLAKKNPSEMKGERGFKGREKRVLERKSNPMGVQTLFWKLSSGIIRFRSGHFSTNNILTIFYLFFFSYITGG